MLKWRRLCRPFVCGYKLSFNVARFTLEEGEIDHRPLQNPHPEPQLIVEKKSGKGKEVNIEVFTGSATFKEAFLGKSSDVREEKVVVLPDNFKAHDHVMGKAVVVRMVDFNALKVVGETIRVMTSAEGVVQYMDGLSVIVSFSANDAAVSFCNESNVKRDTFQSGVMWVGQTFPFERIAWLRVEGVPLHLLDNTVINFVGDCFGKVIQVGQHDRWDSDLSYDYIGVLHTEGKRIQEDVVLQWKGRKYRI